MPSRSNLTLPRTDFLVCRHGFLSDMTRRQKREPAWGLGGDSLDWPLAAVRSFVHSTIDCACQSTQLVAKNTTTVGQSAGKVFQLGYRVKAWGFAQAPMEVGGDRCGKFLVCHSRCYLSTSRHIHTRSCMTTIG